MPMDRSKYPADWPGISRQIREQAGDRCEWPGCGVPNGAVGARDRFGAWHDGDEIEGMGYQQGEHLFGADWDWKMVRIVLTVAHLFHDPGCKDPTHLRAWCQKHHLGYDRAHRAASAAATIRRKRAERIAATGQAVMELAG